MKYICNECMDIDLFSNPCIVDLGEGFILFPQQCIFKDQPFPPNWKEYEDPIKTKEQEWFIRVDKPKNITEIFPDNEHRIVQEMSKKYFGRVKPPKVYCGGCKYFMTVTDGKKTTDMLCCYPENVGDWRSETVFKSAPSEINKNNNCKWFEKKE